MRLVQLAIAAAFVGTPAVAHHIDPTDVVTHAFQTFKETGDNKAVRALFSKALREGAHDGVLDPSFALIFAMYADISRFEGDPSFAMEISQRGLDLLMTDENHDPNVRNALLVSQAYALAELGRYEAAIEQARIQVVWMASEFGQSQADGFQAEIAGWEQKAKASDADYQLPSVAALSTKLLDQARDALDADDTAKAMTLAARALVPAGTGLSEQAVKLLNVRAHTISGSAYAKEGRDVNAMAAYQRAVDLVLREPWSSGSPKFDEEFLSQAAGPDMVWELFSGIAASAPDQAIAASALKVASGFADTPSRRTAVLFQQAGTAFQAKDYSGAERDFLAGMTNARDAGDQQTASLAEFYLAIAHLFLARPADSAKADSPQVRALADAADKAVQAYGDDAFMADYILSTAARLSYYFRLDYKDIGPLADKALAAFLKRQALLSGYEAGQLSSRAERRSFLEIYIGAQYAAEATRAKR